MAGGFSSKSWILLGAVTMVVISSLVPAAKGQVNATSSSNTTEETTSTGGSAGVSGGPAVTGSSAVTGGSRATTTPKVPAGLIASQTQTQVLDELQSICTEAAPCAKNYTVDPTSRDSTLVCNAMKGFVNCIENKCTNVTNSNTPDSLKKAKAKYQDCSGCALQVSVIIMLLAVMASSLF